MYKSDFSNELMNECEFMEYSEYIISVIHSSLRAKRVLDDYPVLQKAMEIEDHVYEKARYHTGLDQSGKELWLDLEATKEYKRKLEKIIKVINEREQDNEWEKLFKSNVDKIVNNLCQEGFTRKIPKKRESAVPKVTTIKKTAKITTNRKTKNAPIQATTTNVIKKQKLPSSTLPPPNSLNLPAIPKKSNISQLTTTTNKPPISFSSLSQPIPSIQPPVEDHDNYDFDDATALLDNIFDDNDSIDFQKNELLVTNSEAWTSQRLGNMATTSSNNSMHHMVDTNMKTNDENWSTALEEYGQNRQRNEIMKQRQATQQELLQKKREGDIQKSRAMYNETDNETQSQSQASSSSSANEEELLRQLQEQRNRQREMARKKREELTQTVLMNPAANDLMF